MSKLRLSTNAKLQAFLDQKDYEDDDTEFYQNVQNEQKKARMKLWRASMYGAGARARIPKLKKTKKIVETSPYKLEAGISNKAINQSDISSAIPPGSHNEQFRMVQYQTRKSLNDPDRVFFATTSIKEGLIPTPNQPPWYVGRSNKVEPPDSSIISAAARYGFRGSKNIKQRMASPFGPPSSTRTSQTPKFLNNGDDIVNEWVPPVIMTVAQTVNNMESPKLWPSNTEYPQGYSKKRLSTSERYKRETTVTLPERPQTSAGLDDYVGRASDVDNTLNTYARMESEGTFLSIALASKKMFENEWNERVVKTANSTLRQTMSREIPPYEAHTLSDPSDHLRYSGSTAFIVHTQSSEELKFRLRMERSNIAILFEQKWKMTSVIFKHVKNRLKRDQTMEFAIADIGDQLRKAGGSIGQPSMMNRSTFVKCLLNTYYLEIANPKMLNALYAAFDSLRTNSIRFADILVALTMLDNPLETATQKLYKAFKIHSDYNFDLPLFDVALLSFTSVCGHPTDKLKIDRLFKDEFRIACYKAAILGPVAASFMAEETQEALSPLKSGKNVAKIEPLYNICNHYLNSTTFVKLLKTSPELLSTFDKCLSERMVGFYGSDARAAETNADGTTATNKDFTWIMGNKKKDLFADF